MRVLSWPRCADPPGAPDRRLWRWAFEIELIRRRTLHFSLVSELRFEDSRTPGWFPGGGYYDFSIRPFHWGWGRERLYYDGYHNCVTCGPFWYCWESLD